MTDHEKAIRQVLAEIDHSGGMIASIRAEQAMGLHHNVEHVRALLTELDAARKGDEILVFESNFARKSKDRYVDILVKIHQLLDPEPINHGGKTFVYENPDPQKVLRYLSDEIRRIPDAFDEAIAQQAGAP